jgi:hypothetical protein
MTSIDRALSDFVDAWNAGRRPQVDAVLEQVGPAERAELAERLGAWLELAPTPAYDAATRERIRAAPALEAARASEQGAAGVLPALLPRWRARAGLGLGDLATQVAAAAGARGEEGRTAALLGRLERGELDGERLSRRLLDVLARALGVPAGALAAAARRPAAAGGTLFRAEEGDWVAAEAEALSRAALAPAPAPMDELDRLFLGGPDA